MLRCFVLHYSLVVTLISQVTVCCSIDTSTIRVHLVRQISGDVVDPVQIAECGENSWWLCSITHYYNGDNTVLSVEWMTNSPLFDKQINK